MIERYEIDLDTPFGGEEPVRFKQDLKPLRFADVETKQKEPTGDVASVLKQLQTDGGGSMTSALELETLANAGEI